MQITSSSFAHGEAIPPRFALGAIDGFGENISPALAWSNAPEGTKSFALLCIDTDAPTDASLAGKEGVEIPVDHPRGDFIHWAVANLSADVTQLSEGASSQGVTKGGKAAGKLSGGTQGRNDYTGWFARDGGGMKGTYHGYDGPYPPPNDLRVHRYFFRLFALDVPALDIPDSFTASDVLRGMQGHVLAEAATYGTYSLRP